MRIIGGKWRGKKIMVPPHLGTRPTADRTRETIFNILLHNPAFGPGVVEGKSILDAFAGTGALGFEALSRGAQAVTFVENNRETLKSLYENLRAFSLSLTCVKEMNVTHFQSPEKFDLVFMDPPYHQDLVLPALKTLIQGNLLSERAVVVIEMGKTESVSLPEELELVTERLSGAAKIMFCYFNEK